MIGSQATEFRYERGRGRQPLPWIDPWSDRGPMFLLRRGSPAVRHPLTLDQLAAPGQIAEGWARVRRNQGGPGGDGVRINDFAVGLEARLGRLSRELLSDRYRPGPLRRVEIAKKDSGVRVLAIPCVRDRVVQAALMLLLDRGLDAQMSSPSFGYRAGRSTGQALERVRTGIKDGNAWIVDADLARFFDEVPHDAMIKCLLERGIEPRVGRVGPGENLVFLGSEIAIATRPEGG